MAKEYVLVVEDSPAVASVLINRILPAGGYESALATDRESALSSIQQRQPDLILLDFQLPGASGLEILEELRASDLSVPVIMMTAHGSENTVAQALRIGIQDYVIKPFSADELLSRVEHVLMTSSLPPPKAELVVDRWRRKLAALEGLGRVGRTAADARILLQRGLEAAAYVAEADQATLHLARGNTGPLVVAAQVGGRATPSQEQTMLQRILASQTGYRPTVLPDEDPTPVLHLPLWALNQPLGVLSLYRQGDQPPFSEANEQFASIVVGYLALVAAMLAPSSLPADEAEA
jgi:two-component system NtrC family sensor kinase